MQTQKKKGLRGMLRVFFQRFRTEDLFWETEKNSNVLAAIGILALLGILSVALIGACLSRLYYDYQAILFYLGVLYVFFLPVSVYCLAVRGDRRWLKYALLLALSLGLSYLHYLSSYPYVLLLAVPIALSSRYYSVHFTLSVAVLTAILYALSVWAGVWIGTETEMDLDYTAFPAGAVITVVEGGWLIDSLQGIEIDKANTLRNLMLVALPGRLLELTVVSLICAAVAKRGHDMVLKESADAAERASIETEISLAAEIQLSELPCTFPAFPSHPGLDLYATMEPAKEVGGDFYDYFEIDDDRIAIVMADVSGKGIPAALAMMRGKALIENALQMCRRPAEAMTLVNAQLSAHNEAGLFITAWLGVLETSTGTLTYVNAGHCRPLLRQGDGAFQPLDELHGLALACLDDTEFTQSELTLRPGDAIFLYTDGVTEAANASRRQYGAKRLAAFFNANGDMSPQTLLPELRRDIGRFVGDAPQLDDITMLMLRIR